VTRIEQLREYRSRLKKDADDLVAEYIEEGCPPGRRPFLSDYIGKIQLRTRWINTEIDRLEADRLEPARLGTMKPMKS
jgi:hypothetical protein